MSVSSGSDEVVQGNVAEPRPDPWSPPEANYAQAASIAAGLGAIAVSESSSGTDDFGMLVDPARLFHVVGASLDVKDARTWVLVLIILSVALNILSFWLRYRYAGQLKAKWERWEEEIRQLGGGASTRVRSGKGMISQS